jgi:ABC-type phosphate transport system substrate-binding protein
MVMRARRPSIFAILLLVLASSTRGAAPPDPSVSFLVSAKNPVRDVSAGDLRRIFLGEISRWSNGHHIILFVRPADTPEGRLFLDRLVRMSDIDYSQWWLGAVFRGRAASAPRVIDSHQGMVKAVATTPDSIGFVVTSPAPLDSGVAVVAVEGHTPSDPRYLVSAR